LQAGTDQTPAILWFRQDLRLADQAALVAAMDGGRPVLPIYILDDESPTPWAIGGAGRWWLHHSLVALEAALAQRGAPLVLRRGRAPEVLRALLTETGAGSIHAGRMHEPWARVMDAAIGQALPGALHLHRTSTLFDPDAIRTKTGGIYGVYTPFARGLRLRGDPAPPMPAPAVIPAPAPPPSDRLEGWGLLPTAPDWAGGFRAAWTPGEAGAQRRLAGFGARAVDGYDAARNVPGQAGTSMLSPHLHWGEVSPGQVWSAVAAASAQRGDGLGAYLGELLWREFAAYLLHHNPHLPEQPLRARFAELPWRRAPSELQAWRRGHTGVPIVDAGMRQLWRTGWMHNRVRMIVASYLTKHLLLPWQDGEAWFWDTLVDADLASNAASWQWVAGCGIDAQPYFRIFNPVSQGEKFDPDGAYVRAWAPELARLPDRWIHAPWTAPEDVLHQARVILGRGPEATYPTPIVDLAHGRQRALDAFKTMNRDAPGHDMLSHEAAA
jgi:deoxyribodipyrimidine photo-lyase